MRYAVPGSGDTKKKKKRQICTLRDCLHGTGLDLLWGVRRKLYCLKVNNKNSDVRVGECRRGGRICVTVESDEGGVSETCVKRAVQVA